MPPPKDKTQGGGGCLGGDPAEVAPFIAQQGDVVAQPSPASKGDAMLLLLVRPEGDARVHRVEVNGFEYLYRGQVFRADGGVDLTVVRTSGAGDDVGCT